MGEKTQGRPRPFPTCCRFRGTITHEECEGESRARAVLLHLHSSPRAFDLLPGGWASHYAPSLSLPIPPSTGPIPNSLGSFIYSPAPDHQTKLTHTLKFQVPHSFTPLRSLLRYPNRTSATTGSVVYTREQDCPFTKLRPIYEPFSFARKDCPLPRRVGVERSPAVPVPIPGAGISIVLG